MFFSFPLTITYFSDNYKCILNNSCSIQHSFGSMMHFSAHLDNSLLLFLTRALNKTRFAGAYQSKKPPVSNGRPQSSGFFCFCFYFLFGAVQQTMYVFLVAHKHKHTDQQCNDCREYHKRQGRLTEG